MSRRPDEPLNSTAPQAIACPRCRRVGLVRMETIIRAALSVRALFCGACGHQWTADNDELPARRTSGL
jgi:transcription elongation factor Elf1